MSYPKPIPVDKNMQAMTDFPPAVKTVQNFAATTVASSVITFQDDATQMEVAAVGGGGAAIRWIATTDTQASVIASGAANADHYIPSGTVRKFVIPKEVATVNSIVGANIKEGLYRRVAWVNAIPVSTSILAVIY